MSATIIHVLDETTANKIAAGEVVERPASVIKELAENSIDALSKTIEVEISDGGTSYIRVTDDGIGMSYGDAMLATLRHATSKITLAEDLESISSLGFRGEALPSIAAVSKFTLTSRQPHNDLAAYIEVHGGEVIDRREAGGNIGTTITVSDLFYNTPARRKFLKTPASESSHIHDVLVKLALSHPDIAFKLLNNNRLVLSTPGNGQLSDTLSSLYGAKIAADILPLSYCAEDISISGFLGKPTLLRSSRQWQTLIVNLRIIQSRFIAKALDNAYRSLLPKTGYPLAVLSLTVPLDSVDVNVHPQKNDIKFADEQKIFRAVYKAVTTVLSDPASTAAMAAVPATEFMERRPPLSQAGYNQSYAGGHGAAVAYSPSAQPPAQVWRETPLSLAAARQTIKSMEPSFCQETVAAGEISVSDNPEFLLQPLGQIEDCYIVAQGPEGLYIIDQHAAHERILYDRMGRSTERIPAQQLLVPLFLDCSEAEIDVVVNQQEIFYSLGFSVEQAGPDTVRLTEMPADVPADEAEALIRQIIGCLQTMHQPTPQELRHACLQMSACRAAIKAGQTLNMRQMQALISDLCATVLPYTCPHGRPAIIRFTPQDLARLFKRT